MKKNKFLWIIAAVAIAAIGLGSCPEPGPGTTEVDPDILTGILVEPATKVIGVGQTATYSPLTASAIPDTAELGDIEWSSEDETKVTVGKDSGVITGVAITDTPVKVYAKSVGNPSISGYCEVTVNEEGVPLESITVTPATKELYEGQKFTPTLTLEPADAADTIKWSSEDDDYVTVDEDTGEITAVAATTTAVKVYATSVENDEISGYCEVTVLEAPNLTAITVSPSTLSLEVNQTSTLTAAKTPAEATDTIKWSSEDDTKVTVNEDTGEITAVAVTTTAVKVYATSVENPTISGFSSITVTEAPIVSNIELKLAFIQGETFADTPPTLPAPDADNVYTFDEIISSGNWATASGFVDVILVYPDLVLSGDFKFRARVQLTDTAALTSTSKGLIIGAFKGATGPGDFASGAGGTLTTGTNLRLSGALRNYQSRQSDNLAAVGVNVATIHDKYEEFIYEVIRTEAGILTTMYVSKNGDKLSQYSNDSPIGWSAGNPTSPAHIQADTPVYAGVAIAAAGARISQIKLWDGDLDGAPVYYSGDSTAAPVDVSGITVTVKTADKDKGIFVPPTGANPGSANNPANFYVTETAANGSLELEATLIPAYADIPGANFYLSTDHTNDSSISVNQTTGVVTITGTSTEIRSATIEAQSIDPILATYYLTITVTPDYVPVDEFAIIDGSDSIGVNGRTTFRTDIPITVTDPEIVWTKSSNAIKFWDGEEESDTFTGSSVTVIGKTMTNSVTITATATTKDGDGNPTTKSATRTIAVTNPVSVLWEWTKGDAINNSGNGVEINGITVTRGGGQLASAPAEDGEALTGALKMTGGARWVFGLPETPEYVGGTAAGVGVYVKNAELDLSRKYKLTIIYAGSTGTVFAGALNTNTGGNNAGPVIGDGSNKGLTLAVNGVVQAAANWSLATLFSVNPSVQSNGELVKLEVTVDPAFTTLTTQASTAGFTMTEIEANQFIQLRCDSSTTPLWITYIKLEYVDDDEEDDG